MRSSPLAGNQSLPPPGQRGKLKQSILRQKVFGEPIPACIDPPDELNYYEFITGLHAVCSLNTNTNMEVLLPFVKKRLIAYPSAIRVWSPIVNKELKSFGFFHGDFFPFPDALGLVADGRDIF
jgi:hypothetical protein